MGPPGNFNDPNTSGENPSTSRIFGIDDPAPYETQQELHQYLSQETRHNIIQILLGHPSHLASMTELNYFIPRSRSAIKDQLTDLEDHKIIAQYHHEPNADSRNMPSDFWGFTEFGINVLGEYKYLRGLPMLRSIHNHTNKSETVKRHESAPRPPLPEAVWEALEYDEPDTLMDGKTSHTELREQTIFADAAPEDPNNLNEDADGSRSLNDLW